MVYLSIFLLFVPIKFVIEKCSKLDKDILVEMRYYVFGKDNFT